MSDEFDVTPEELKAYELSNMTRGIDYMEQDAPDLPGEDRHLVAVRSLIRPDNVAPGSTQDSAKFLREMHTSGSARWRRLCLQLQRMAREIPAVYPTAFSASQAVPKSERVLKVDDYRRGMVGFSYDPRIQGTAGHIFFIVGRLKDGTILTATNDAKAPGEVDYVPLGFYSERWGQKLQFAATNLNGYDFSDFNKPPEPIHKGTLGARYENSIDILRRIRADKRKKHGADHYLVRMLTRDIQRMTDNLNKVK